MTRAHLRATVRLLEDVPTLRLRRGDVGVVWRLWLAPDYGYEVEFRQPGQSVTAILGPELLELAESGSTDVGGDEGAHVPFLLQAPEGSQEGRSR